MPVSPADPNDPEAWQGIADVCGSCIAWRSTQVDQSRQVASGICKLRPELQSVPADMKKCTIYKPRGQFVYSPGQSSSPKRRRAKVLKVVRIDEKGQKTETTHAQRRPPREAPKSLLPTEINLGDGASETQIKQLLIEVFRTELSPSKPSIHPKFEGGKVSIHTANGKSNEVSAERLFAQLVHLQDSLDSLESSFQRLAGKLGDRLTTDLDGQLKRIRGTMTTFNVMFREKTDFFSSK